MRGITSQLAILLVARLALGSNLVHAQPQSKQPIAVRTEEYCELIANQPPFNSKISLSVDFGTNRLANAHESGNPDADADKVQSCSSTVDALNYLNSKGWELVNSFSITASQQRYLLRRRIR